MTTCRGTLFEPPVRGPSLGRSCRVVAGYSLPALGTLEGWQTFLHADLDAMSLADLEAERSRCRLALDTGDREVLDRLLYSVRPGPMTVRAWLRERLVAVEDDLARAFG
jgi:hypothetical protein